jgi:hypothetical protein
MATTTFLSNATINLTQGATTTDLSDQANQCTITVGQDALEITAFGDTGHRMAGGLQSVDVINNCSLICKDDIETNLMSSVIQSTSSFNFYCGSIGLIIESNIQNLNINLKNYTINGEAERTVFGIGGLCGVITGFVSPSTGTSDISYCNLQCQNFIVNCKRPIASSQTSGGNFIAGGIGSAVIRTNISNFSTIFDNLSLNVNQEQNAVLGFTRIGGLSASNFNTNNTPGSLIPLSIEYCTVIVNKNFNVNMNLNYNNTSSVICDIGALFGFCSISSTCALNFNPKFNLGFINNYNFTVTDNSPIKSTNVIINSGGAAGRVNSDSSTTGVMIFYSNYVFFGESSIQNIPTTPSGPVSYTAGVIGQLGLSTRPINRNNATNCACIYNNYKIVGQTYNKTIDLDLGTATNVLSISYGAPIDSEGVQDIDGPSTTNAVIALFNVDINTEWLAFLLKFRQSLDSSLTSAQYLEEVLNVSTSAYTKTVLNAAFQNSMYFNGITNFDIPFLTIKDSLIDYTDIPDDALVEYLIPTDNVYTLNDKKLYYLFQNLASIKNKDLTVPYSIQYEPASIVMTDDNTEKVTLLGEESTLSNGAKIKFSGIGSGLVEIIPVTPVPPTPSGSNTNNWWWITILIIFAIILCVVIFLIFFCDKSPKIDFISLNI